MNIYVLKYRSLSQIAITVFLILSVLVYGLIKLKATKAEDYYQFWLVGQALESLDIQNIYSRVGRTLAGKKFQQVARSVTVSGNQVDSAERHKVPQLAGTPFLYAAFDLISTGNFDLDYQIFRIASLIIYISSLFVLSQLLGFRMVHSAFWVVLFTLFFWPVRNDIRLGNVTQLQLGTMTAFLWCTKRFPQKQWCYWGWFFLGLGTLFKPTIFICGAVLIAAWLVHRQYSDIAMAGAGLLSSLVVGYVVPQLMFGSSCSWVNWFFRFDNIALVNHFLKDSFPYAILGIKNIQSHYLLVCLFFLIYLWVIYTRMQIWQKKNKRSSIQTHELNESRFLDHFEWFSTGILIYMLGAPLIHGQYLILCIPLIMFHARSLAKTTPKMTKESIVALACYLMIATHFVRAWHYEPIVSNHWWNYGAVLLLYLIPIVDVFYLRRSSERQGKPIPAL